MGLTKHRSQNKNNSKDRYITNPKTLQSIAKTIDRACQQAPEDSVRSFADFKQLIEDSSNQKVGVDICEIDGVVRSFRFYLQDRPNQTTTSRYLAQGTGQDSGEYSPQSVANYFGFAQSVDEVDDELNNERQKLALDSDDNFDDDNFDDDDFIKDEFNDSLNNRSQNQGASISVDRPFNLESSDDFEEDEFDLDADVLEEEDEWLNPPSNQANSLYSDAVEQIDNAIDLSEVPDKASYQNDSTHQVLRDASVVAQQAATQGSEVNGVNLIGDAATGALMATALLNQLLAEQDNESTSNPYIERIKGLIESYEQVERRIVDIEQQAQKVEEQISSNDRLEIQEFDELSSRVYQVAQRFDSFNPRVDGLEEKISQLEKKLDVEPDSSTLPQSSLPIFEEGDNIDRRLDKLAAYAKHLNERLDKFEERLNQLQETIDNLTENQNSTQNIDSAQVEEQLAQTSDISNSEKNRSPSDKTPYRTRQRAQIEL